MIVYCRSCKQTTIARDQIGARCSWCDHVLITACICCTQPVYPKKRRGPAATRCDVCQTLGRSTHHDHAPAAA